MFCAACPTEQNRCLVSVGILIEDQLAPKSCGHVKGKKVVSREEAVMRIKAAADAR